ncbi:RNA polymerase sigma factor [Saccharicrinis aurantiacus]|uniref:RNA polymerase sigma factor n=1 Tax=Saccharicrinis aurantiacus TaxID=1849719 RepID=UPI00094F78B0|nr:RNA polymerase sigma factor [Saccharicrinis aurantiacus]
MTTSNEIEQIQMASNGNIQAFEQIINSYKEKVINICYSYCNNQHDAEDIAQEVFIELYKSMKKFNHKSTFSTWIYRIASNKSLDFLRAQGRTKRGAGLVSFLGDDNYITAFKSSESTASDEIINEQRKEFLYAGLSKLANRQKEAFVLTQVEGLPQKEVAEIMETTVKSIEVLVVRARKKLKTVLEKQIKNYL